MRGALWAATGRYDRTAKVTGREANEARALHVIADLLDDYPGIDAPVIASRLGEILRCTAIELPDGHVAPASPQFVVAESPVAKPPADDPHSATVIWALH